jgi:hypothetical protein
MRLYRPVGLNELLSIYESEMTMFPPRLTDQPIFYPVLNAPYAVQIAREWNTRRNTFAGYVTQFDVADDYAARFEPHIVGSREHEELWVPAEELIKFNGHITGKIAVVEAYFGDRFRGYIPERFNLKGKDAVEQFVVLESLWRYNVAMDLVGEMRANHKAVFAHFPFWMQHDFLPLGIPHDWRYQVLRGINTLWEARFSDIKLCYAGYA